MDSTSCGMQKKGSKSLAGELLGTDGQHKKTQELLCQKYIVQSERVVYRIRPKDDKHPALLPIGETAQFRIHKDKLILRVPEPGGKEREYIVVSMTPSPRNSPSRRPTKDAVAITALGNSGRTSRLRRIWVKLYANVSPGSRAFLGIRAS